jgi:hypothetical protein
MTYGRVLLATHPLTLGGAAVSHSAELVRGEYCWLSKAPSSAPSGHLLPKGRRVVAAFASHPY